MRKIKALAAVLFCTSLLFGCGKNKDNDNNSQTQQTVAEVSTEEPKTTGSTGADDVPREAIDYSDTDEIFLGEWVDVSDGVSTLTITEDSPQTGGYFLEFTIYRTISGAANVNRDGDGLSVNQGFFDDNPSATVYTDNHSRFYGTLKKTDNGISFTITESESELVPAGTVYEYTRKSE
ncbi:MAG: hypothetical protein IJ763_06615 [Lachnospiraceae bacterium]|nr:hypothetical protein [Lachnospiraceae bacterium]